MKVWLKNALLNSHLTEKPMSSLEIQMSYMIMLSVRLRK